MRAETTVTGIDVALASTGIRAADTAAVILNGVTIDAETVGVAAERGSTVNLISSSVHAPHTTRGDVHLTGVNDLSQPLNLLGVIGLPLLLLALVLEFLHLFRQLHRQRALRRESLRRWHAIATAEPDLAIDGCDNLRCLRWPSHPGDGCSHRPGREHCGDL